MYVHGRPMTVALEAETLTMLSRRQAKPKVSFNQTHKNRCFFLQG